MGKRVLIVDDDPSILRAMELFLRLKGVEVVCTTDPQTVLPMVQKTPPDLLISDIAMPVVDGFTLLKALKENAATQTIPVVLLTSMDRIADVERGYAGGAVSYILKPIDWDRTWPKIEPYLKSG